MIPTSNGPLSPYWRPLLTIAKQQGVQVHTIPGSRDLDWDGLYVCDDTLGPGIALRAELPAEWLAWVLAHELGHHVERVNRQLFSPFLLSTSGREESGRDTAAHKFASFSHGRWGRWRRLDPTEERANEWAAKTLIDAGKWRQAEDRNPLNLHAIVAALELPMPAALAWERIRRKAARPASRVSINFDRRLSASIMRKVQGTGGHQSLLRRLLSSRAAGRSALTFHDFSLARERLLTVGGGWRPAYEYVLKAVLPHINKAGGVSSLFGLQ